jgi:HEAT repeat protein
MLTETRGQVFARFQSASRNASIPIVARYFIPAFALIVFGALDWAFASGNASGLAMLLQMTGAPVAASNAKIAEHELEEIDRMPPQDQVTRLLERTINHYQGAPEEISKRIAGWTGQIHSTAELENLTNTAYFSNDLRVRAAALEIWLARDNFQKTPETVDELIGRAAATSERRYFVLSNLGILGNRGVEPEKALQTLLLYVQDPDADTRAAAINGLGLLGTEGTIAPLLAVFHNDSSHDLRERAACNLADSGMLSRELRKKAVPELVRFSQDLNRDATTEKWVYQALREITQQNFRDDPGAWVSWFGANGQTL